ncbi:MAG TPA: UbiA family prenyltransferase [Chitinophagales bacterium]|nr:UbiA family prenyltransferase [Chitinophagales bacterium]HNM32068.1 UbiA family prenyltransferase [Chitinophagales bacterium]
MLRIVKLLIETNLFIAFAAVAFMWASIFLLDIYAPSFWILSVQVFFSTWFVYQVSRWVYYKKGVYTNKKEWVVQLFDKYPNFTPVTMAISLIIAIITTLFLKPLTILALCVTGFFSVLYPIPFLKPFGIHTRLRDFPFVKIFLIAFVWSTTSVILPFTETGISFNSRRDILIVWILQLVYIFYITLPFDINDAESDKLTGTKTIPSVIGVKASKIIGLLTGIVHIILLIYVYLLENWRSITHIYLKESTIIGLILLTILLQGYTFIKADKVEKWNIKVVYDGSMIVYYFIMLFNHISK